MPSISDLNLTIQKATVNLSRFASRLVTVDYHLGFTRAEINARANFRVRVSLRSDDSDLLPIRTFDIVAVAGGVSRTETKTFQRRQLDEEADFETEIGQHGQEFHFPIENTDVWSARVSVFYVPEPVFGSVNAFSPPVIGSWGNEGED